MAPPRGPARRVALHVLALIGLAVTIFGTFLPWLGSGTTERNSYAAGGAARRLLSLGQPLHGLLGAWPLLGLVAAAAVAVALLGHPALGLALAGLVAVVAGGTAAAMLPVQGNRYAHVITTGPWTTLCGAMLVALAAVITVVLALAGRVHDRRLEHPAEP